MNDEKITLSGNTYNINSNMITGTIKKPDYKSIIKIGDNITIYNTAKFNCFQKKMIKICFGFEVIDYDI